MLVSLFSLAMASPGRQRAFRFAACVHIACCAAAVFAVTQNRSLLPVAAQLLVVLGIVEGAVILGWRLTQFPKSRALEFLLVSPVRPRGLFLIETAAGTARLVLVGLA